MACAPAPPHASLANRSSWRHACPLLPTLGRSLTIAARGVAQQAARVLDSAGWAHVNAAARASPVGRDAVQVAVDDQAYLKWVTLHVRAPVNGTDIQQQIGAWPAGGKQPSRNASQESLNPCNP